MNTLEVLLYSIAIASLFAAGMCKLYATAYANGYEDGSENTQCHFCRFKDIRAPRTRDSALSVV